MLLYFGYRPLKGAGCQRLSCFVAVFTAVLGLLALIDQIKSVRWVLDIGLGRICGGLLNNKYKDSFWPKKAKIRKIIRIFVAAKG